MAWDFETEPEFEEQLAWMRAFIDRELIPLEPIFDELAARTSGTVVKAHLQDQVKAQGCGAPSSTRSSAASGFGQLKLALMSEIIGRCMMSMTIFGVQAPDSGNMELLAHGATDAQKERWLWPNLRGEISSAFALTEPFLAGADPTVIGTTAIKDGDEWVIDGPQVVHHQRLGGRHRPGVRRDQPRRPSPPPRVDLRRSRRERRAWRSCATSARWRTPTSPTAARESCRDRVPRLPRTRRPPDRRSPGDGFVLAQQRLGGGRIHHAMRWLGTGAAIARHHVRAGRVANARTASSSAQHQMIQDYIALSHTEIQAARLLTFQTAWKMDKYGAAAVRADLGMVKAHVSKVVLAVLDRTIQVCGALGYSSDLPVEAWYRSTRFGPIGDGPDELHKSVLARTLLKGYTPVEGWPTEHIPSRRPAAEARSGPSCGDGLAGGARVRAVFFDFAGTLFSDRALRDAHLRQLRFVARTVGVEAHRRASCGPPTAEGMGDGLPAPWRCDASYRHRTLFAAAFTATAVALGGDDRRGHRRRGGRSPVPSDHRGGRAAARLPGDAGRSAAASIHVQIVSNIDDEQFEPMLERLDLYHVDRRWHELGAGRLLQAGSRHLPLAFDQGGHRCRTRCSSSATACATTSKGRRRSACAPRGWQPRRRCRSRQRPARRRGHGLAEVLDLAGVEVGR